MGGRLPHRGGDGVSKSPAVRDVGVRHRAPGARATRCSRHGEQQKRLCKARIEEWIQQDNPELERLLSLAEGVTTLLGPPFGYPGEIRPSGSDGWPKRRWKFERVAPPAVERMLIESFNERGLALILGADSVRERIPEALLHASGWAPKRGEAKARNTSDGKDCGDGTPINSPLAKKRAIERWGPCENPTDTDIWSWASACPSPCTA